MDRIEVTAKNLANHGFQVQVFDNAAQAKEAALSIIGKQSVGFGGSMTVHEMGLYETLQEQGNGVYWHWRAKDKSQFPEIFKKAHEAEVYLSSSNAILESGALLNIDGTGNRLENLFSGPKTVIVIAGENKLCADYEDALKRIKRDACPPNARRLNLKTPCAAKECTDCNTPDRMCNVTLLLERPSNLVKNVHVFLVKKSLGF
ncbi:lactate utilization protein [Christensenellaceae bacterium OttesenSCG-928-M15]|nr:lactate utilization protein [Christensenellaceae bacterium OttesenSCG-928-M15]